MLPISCNVYLKNAIFRASREDIVFETKNMAFVTSRGLLEFHYSADELWKM